MSTCVFYIDESGNVSRHSIPIRNGETPIFILTSVALPLEHWRDFDRDYLRIKRQFFAREIQRDTNAGKTLRPEHWEAKGNELCAPRNRTSRRRHAFLDEVLDICERYNARAFGITFLKNPDQPTSPTALYGMALQYLAERFSIFLGETSAYQNGVLILDPRGKKLDFSVSVSYMSFIFGHDTGRQLTNILEGPLFADSRLTAGLQIADNVSGLLYASHYHYYCRDLLGALDYSHVAGFWPRLDALQFKSRELFDGRPVFGYRVIDFT